MSVESDRIGWNVRIGTCAVALALTAGTACGAPFVNDITLPSHLYLLKGERNEIFVQPFLKRWRPYDDFVRFDAVGGKDAFLRRLSRVATVTNPVEGTALTVSLVNGDEFKTIKELKPVLRVAEPRVGTKEVFAQVVGDSFTHGGFYRDALVASGYVPKLRLVGLRQVSKENNDCHEGRGGWRLDTYFTVPKGEQFSYHGFMQPKDGRYWGDRDFWKMAWRCVRKTQPKGFQPTYSCEYFGACAPRFDERTGILKNPQTGDCQYDSTRREMLRWDGRYWQPVKEKDLRFGFDYGKYLAMWNLKAPQFLFVYLGFNDFASKGLDSDYSNWLANITTFKKSYEAAVPGGKFVIAIPLSATGLDDNRDGEFSTLKNAVMWRFRDWLIKTFDNREKEGWYLLDGGLAIDNEYGYYVMKRDDPKALPYKLIKEPERIKIQWGNPHPYPNYPAAGVPFAAFIQYWRDRKP